MSIFFFIFLSIGWRGNCPFRSFICQCQSHPVKESFLGSGGDMDTGANFCVVSLSCRFHISDLLLLISSIFLVSSSSCCLFLSADRSYRLYVFSVPFYYFFRHCGTENFHFPRFGDAPSLSTPLGRPERNGVK